MKRDNEGYMEMAKRSRLAQKLPAEPHQCFILRIGDVDVAAYSHKTSGWPVPHFYTAASPLLCSTTWYQRLPTHLAGTLINSFTPNPNAKP